MGLVPGVYKTNSNVASHYHNTKEIEINKDKMAYGIAEELGNGRDNQNRLILS